MSRVIAKGRVANRLREHRRNIGLTQAELAARVSAARQTIVAVEAGKYAPSLELAFRIARAFDAPFEAVWSYTLDEGASAIVSAAKRN